MRMIHWPLLSLCFAAPACMQMPIQSAAPSAQVGSAQADLGPRDLLAQARQAVDQHQQNAAYAAVDQAETVWNRRNGAWESNAYFAGEPDEAREMARAKQAIQMQDWPAADYYIDTAMRGPLMATP